jgi:hypothetical protein
LPEGLCGNGLKQRLAIGEMPVRRRLRYAKFFRQGLDADGFRPALFRLPQRRLHQRLAEIAVVVSVLRLAHELRRHGPLANLFA